ncbi:MAG: type VI secretion system tube protein Hcp [Verrucomicrobia bacterium]|nr:type VI secretion system tube protein Hcp [Verrucomicrobiota bacterium]MBI3870360.1 type VI secretion system tube protein Hcp [Verrucomicrobiota bacterium]
MKHIRYLLTLVLALGSLSVANAQAPLSSSAASTVYMKLQAQKQGVIKGEVIKKGLEQFHSILAYSHEIVSPRDPASGLPTGRRQHQPFRVVKLLNSGSPQLLTAMANNENFPTITIDVWAPNPTGAGAESKIMTYTLINASLVSLRPWMPNQSDTAAASYPPAEELSFNYESIKVTWINGGIEGQDTWNTLVR